MPDNMQREPVLVPRKPGVFALVNKSKRQAYVAYTTDLQKRSHSLAHMLQNPDTHWSIKDLPKNPAGEHTFMVVAEGIDETKAEKVIRLTVKKFTESRYHIVSGSRSAVPLVTFKGQEMTLAEAIKKAKCKDKYITVWRRLDRGWSVEQAVGVSDPPVRWSRDENEARRKRASDRRKAA